MCVSLANVGASFRVFNLPVFSLELQGDMECSGHLRTLRSAVCCPCLHQQALPCFLSHLTTCWFLPTRDFRALCVPLACPYCLHVLSDRLGCCSIEFRVALSGNHPGSGIPAAASEVCVCLCVPV